MVQNILCKQRKISNTLNENLLEYLLVQDRAEETTFKEHLLFHLGKVRNEYSNNQAKLIVHPNDIHNITFPINTDKYQKKFIRNKQKKGYKNMYAKPMIVPEDESSAQLTLPVIVKGYRFDLFAKTREIARAQKVGIDYDRDIFKDISFIDFFSKIKKNNVGWIYLPFKNKQAKEETVQTIEQITQQYK